MTSPTPPPAAAPEVFAFHITPEFAAALAAFQADPPKIEKNKLVEVETAENKDDYDYSYATLDHVSAIVLPKLAAHGLSFTAYPGTGSSGKMALRYFLIHKSGGYIGTEWPISSEAKGMRAVQNLGGLITYARRYALQAATGVAAENDDDDLRSAARAEADTPTTARRRSTQQAREAVSAPRNPDAPISQPQQQKLIMQFRDLRVENRESRLGILSQLQGRRLETLKDLNMGEAHGLIEVIGSALQTPDPIATLRRVAEDVAARTPADTPEGSPE
jgi:hypothetical protein